MNYPQLHGGASVLLSKPQKGIEVYNDIGKNVYSLFKCLQDVENFGALKDRLDLSYYLEDTRKEFIEKLKEPDIDIVDRAYMFFYVNNTSFNGTGGFSTSTYVRRNMSANVSRFLRRIDRLPEIHNRLSSVIIENKNIFDILEKYDDKDVFLYLDPPYPHSTRTSNIRYENEMTDEQHEKLIDIIMGRNQKS